MFTPELYKNNQLKRQKIFVNKLHLNLLTVIKQTNFETASKWITNEDISTKENVEN